MEKTIALGLAALVIAATPAAASARVIVDTGTPVGWSAEWSLFGEDIPPQGQYLAARFDLNHATALTNVEAYVAAYGGTFTVSVASDSGGDPSTSAPLTTLYSEQAHASVAGSGAWSGVHGVDWALGAGSYWVIFSVQADQGDTLAGYLPNNAPNPTSAEAYYDLPGDTWGREDDLDFGVRINDSVPEPATWTMMIGGFALAGAGLRRRRSAPDLG